MGTQIRNNSFSNFYAYGIYLSYQKGVKVIGNTIRTNSVSSGYYMIYQYYNTDSFCVSKNTLIHEKNGYGMYSYYAGNSTSDSCVISNNMIVISQTSSDRYGIRLYYPRGVKVAHNSVSLQGNAVTSYCFGIDGGGGSNEVLNNIFENQAGGYVQSYKAPASIAISDYNNLRTTGTQFGYYNSSPVSTMNAWRSISGFDSNSTAYNPGFVANDDLHIAGVDLDGTVMRVPYVLDDIDGQGRDSLADLGADEIRLKGLDAGIAKILTPNQPFKSDTQFVKVVLKNFGSTTLTSVDIHWVFQGDTGTG
jgi:parallel beta-helix repeat protein